MGEGDHFERNSSIRGNAKDYMSRLSGLNRRSFISALSGLGVSSFTLKHLTQDAFAENVENIRDEVPYVDVLSHTNHDEVKNGDVPDRKPIYDTISRDIWEEIHTAINASRKVNEIIDNKFNSNLISSGIVGSGQGTRSDFKVQVDYVILNTINSKQLISPDENLDDVKNKLPNSIKGKVKDNTIYNNHHYREVPVIVRKLEKQEAGGSCGSYYDGGYRPIPAGCSFEGSKGQGTMGTPARTSNGKECWATCAHLHYSEGDPVHQPGCDGIAPCTNAGYVKGIDLNGDAGIDIAWGIFEDETSSMYRLAAKGGGTKPGEIMGIVTFDSLTNNVGNPDYKLYSQGNRTGLSEGWVTETKDLRDPYRRIVWTNTSGGHGDSGGPIFREVTWNNDTYIYIATIGAWFWGEDCPYEHWGGNAMEWIENKYNIIV